MNKSLRTIPIMLVLYAILIYIPSLAHAEIAARQQVQLKAGAALQQIKTDSETSVRVRWHRDRGTVRSIYNLTLPVPPGTLETSARQCLNDYCDLFAMTDPNIELRFKKIQNSLTGSHVRFHQYYKGIEVYGAAISVHINNSGRIRVIHSNYFPKINISTAASLAPEGAINIAINASGAFDLRRPPQVSLVVFSNPNTGQASDYTDAYRLAYRTVVHFGQPLSSWEYIIDANTGELLHRRSRLRFADGRGRVFNPNPIVALKDFTLMDQDDSADAIPAAAYTDVILPELDGSGLLDGRYVSTRLTENRANEPTLVFNYLRDDPRFEEVMVYYHVDAVGHYLKGLGFDFVDDWQIPANVHTSERNEAFYDESDGSIHFGDGGADLAEDAEVIIHEYGHAILDRQVPSISTSEGAAIHEGFSDFLAASFFSAVSDGFSDSIVFEWAGAAAPEIFTRPVNGFKHYPEDIQGEPHADGEMWSASLWEIFEMLGRDASIRLVIESHFFLSPDAEFTDGVSAIFVADQELNGGVNAELILGVMENRGFLTPPRLASDTFEENDTAATAAAIEIPFINEELSIHTPDNDDYYRFNLAETKQVGVGIDFQPIYGELMLTLMGPAGVALVTFETKDVTSLELMPGDYLVTVSGINGATNDYKLALIVDSHGDTSGAATAMAIGDTLDSFIDFSGDTDFFAFEGKEGEQIDITVVTNQSDLDSLLVIYTPTGDLLAKNDDAFAAFPGLDPPPGFINPRGVDSSVNVELPIDGTYLLAVSNIAPPKLNAPFGGLNYSYTLSLTTNIDDHAECGSGEETPLVFNEPVTGVISAVGVFGGGDSDGFRFEAAAGDVIALLVEVESAGVFIMLRLLDESGEELLSLNTPFDGSDLRLDGFPLPDAGVYCVEVSGFPPVDDYSYTLTLSEGELPDDDHESRWGNPTPITAEVPIDGAISFAGDADAFQFSATAGSIITFNVEMNRDTLFFALMLNLYDDELQHLVESYWSEFGDDDGVGFNPLQNGFTIPETGTYYVEVTNLLGSGSEDFTYTLTLTVEGGTIGEGFPPYDVNRDGRVDVFDLVLVGQHFGEKFINATPPADFGQRRSVSPEGEVQLLMTPSVTDTRRLTVSINTTAVADLYGYHFSIQYDPAVLEFFTASPSSVFATPRQKSYWHISQQGTQLELIQTRQGTITGVETEGTLATLVFDVKKTDLLPAHLPIQLVDLQLADSLTRAIPVQVANQQVSMKELFPEKPMLMQNYPNPFNPETWIPYQLSADSEVVISIYNTNGERIRQFDLGYQQVGTYITRGRALYWNGEDMYGEPVASGVYFYQIQADAFSTNRKMVIIK